MPTTVDLLNLARRIDHHAEEADGRGNVERANELRQLATALRAKHYQRLANRRLSRRTAG